MNDNILTPEDLPVHQIVTVELQVDGDVNVLESLLQHACQQAVENALKLVEANGFSHDCANELSIGLVSVDVETQRWRCSNSECKATMTKLEWSYELMAKNGHPGCVVCNLGHDMVLESP